MNNIAVEFGAGESRNSNLGCDYMFATAEIDGEEIELYAESTDCDYVDENGNIIGDEYKNFEPLKAEIIARAKEHGISEEYLVFNK